MIPRPQQALGDLAMKLLVSVAPETQTPYAASTAGMIALFESLRDVPPETLTSRIKAFLQGSITSLRIEHLNARHAQGMELLIELHAWAETHRAEELDREIWSFLVRHADRHAYQLA